MRGSPRLLPRRAVVPAGLVHRRSGHRRSTEFARPVRGRRYRANAEWRESAELFSAVVAGLSPGGMGRPVGRLAGLGRGGGPQRGRLRGAARGGPGRRHPAGRADGRHGRVDERHARGHRGSFGGAQLPRGVAAQRQHGRPDSGTRPGGLAGDVRADDRTADADRCLRLCRTGPRRTARASGPGAHAPRHNPGTDRSACGGL